MAKALDTNSAFIGQTEPSGGGEEGGGGPIAFTDLTDADSVDLPALNTPLAASLVVASGSLAHVDYLDENYCDFSTGVVDTTQDPYNSLATEGQSVVCAQPTGPADAGIWVLGSIANPEAVPVTRRSDVAVGVTLTKGQEVRVGSSTPPFAFARCMPYDPEYNNWQDAGVVGTDILEFTLGSNKQYSVASGYQSEASGDGSTASGFLSVASGDYSIASGRQSAASGWGSIALGAYSVASGDSSIAIGGDASGGSSVAIGDSSTASGDRSVAIGAYSVASGAHSVARGRETEARVLGSETCGSSGKFITVGDAQCAHYALKTQTSDATPTMVSSGVEYLVLPNNASFHFTGHLVARQPTTGDSKSWKFEGLIKRGANAAATALVAAVTPSAVAGDAGASAWEIAVTADTTNGALAITVTGEAAKNIQWVCGVDTVETFG